MIHYDRFDIDHNESYNNINKYIVLITSWKDLIIINMLKHIYRLFRSF